MSRRRWLVAYDIREGERLRRVHDVVRCYGERLQYSVFLCDLDSIEKLKMLEELRMVLNDAVDSVVLIDLGEPNRSNSSTIEFIGARPQFPTRGPRII